MHRRATDESDSERKYNQETRQARKGRERAAKRAERGGRVKKKDIAQEEEPKSQQGGKQIEKPAAPASREAGTGERAMTQRHIWARDGGTMSQSEHGQQGTRESQEAGKGSRRTDIPTRGWRGS